MTNFVFANNVNTTLAGNVSSSAMTITLASAANLPASIPSGFVMALTLNDVATRNNYEIVYVTDITGATLTVQRAQEGTSALSWLTGDFAFSGPTAGQQASFAELSGSNTWTGGNTFNNPPVVPNAAANDEAINLGQAQANFAAINGSSAKVFNVAQAATSTEAMPLGQLPSQFPSSLTTNGYKKYPDSNSPTGYFVEQWGVATTVNADGSATLSFPIAFANSCLNIQVTNSANSPPRSFGGVNITGNSQFVLWTASSGGVNPGPGQTFYWRAIGY